LETSDIRFVLGLIIQYTTPRVRAHRTADFAGLLSHTYVAHENTVCRSRSAGSSEATLRIFDRRCTDTRRTSTPLAELERLPPNKDRWVLPHFSPSTSWWNALGLLLVCARLGVVERARCDSPRVVGRVSRAPAVGTLFVLPSDQNMIVVKYSTVQIAHRYCDEQRAASMSFIQCFASSVFHQGGPSAVLLDSIPVK
jgi:hypothetical protein